MAQDFTPDASVTNHPIPAYLATLVRQGAVGATSWAVGAGYIQADQVEGIIGAAVVIASVAWGIYDRHSRQKKLNAAIAAPAGAAQ